MCEFDDDVFMDEYLFDEPDCGQFEVGGVVFCAKVGSEECDCCPHYHEIGRRMVDIIRDDLEG